MPAKRDIRKARKTENDPTKTGEVGGKIEVFRDEVASRG
jgi:hypothetical protein